MPNTFGGKPILDPKFIAQRCNERGLPTDWLSLATSVTVPTMEEPGRAFFLMARKDVRTLTVTTEHTLSLTDWNKEYTFQKFTIDRADVVVPGLDDDNAVMLVQAYDRRGRMLKSAFSAAYNLRINEVYVSSTLNSGSAWSWSGMLSDIWDEIPDVSESAPSLPFSPSGTPEGFDFYAHPSAFTAYCDVLRRIGCVLVYNPIADTFTVEQAGATDAGFTTFTNASAKEKLYDSFTVEGVRIPANLKVYFRRTPRPTNGEDPYYEVSVAVSGGNAGTVAVHDELFALGSSGTPSNAAALSTRASERASDLARRLGADRLSRTVRGVWPTSPAALGGKASALEIRDHGGGLSLGIRNQDFGTKRPELMFEPGSDATGGTLCSEVINVCAIPKYAGNVAGVFTISDTTFTDAVLLPTGGGIRVSRRGWCGWITAALWSSGTATITSPGHRLKVGTEIIISSVDPSGYNGSFSVASVSGDDFTVAIASDPGTYSSGGLIHAPDLVYCDDNPTGCCDECDTCGEPTPDITEAPMGSSGSFTGTVIGPFASSGFGTSSNQNVFQFCPQKKTGSTIVQIRNQRVRVIDDATGLPVANLSDLGVSTNVRKITIVQGVSGDSTIVAGTGSSGGLCTGIVTDADGYITNWESDVDYDYCLDNTTCSWTTFLTKLDYHSDPPYPYGGYTFQLTFNWTILHSPDPC